MVDEIMNTILRSTLAFFLLMLITRFLGRKAIAQMTFFDFCIAITLGSVTANLSIGPNITPLSAATVLISFGFLGITMGYIATKSFLVRKTVNSEPVVLIQNNEIVKKNMQKTRLTVNDLTTLLRKKNIFNVADVEFAILENDGNLSTQLKSQKQPVTPSDLNIPTSYKGLTKDMVIDGNIMYENLQDANLDEKWLRNELKNKGINDVSDVFFAALDTTGNLYVSKGIVGQEKHGKYGID